MRTTLLLFAIASVALAGCSAPEMLARKSATAPSENELSGRWTMLEDIDTANRQLDRAIVATNGIDDARELRRLNSALARGNQTPVPKVGGLVHVFLENGKSLKITQIEKALFIEFDRSVVEEYSFGEVRMVRVGEVMAQRVSGWEGEQYVVETLDRDGMKLTERYHLMEDKTHLRRQIIFRSEKGDEVINFQTYQLEEDQ